MTTPVFGAGIWHFATYLDRYATDGYGTPRTILEAIDLAGQVKDLSVVDLNWPYFGASFPTPRSRPRWSATSCAPSASRPRFTPVISSRAPSPIPTPASGARRMNW